MTTVSARVLFCSFSHKILIIKIQTEVKGDEDDAQYYEVGANHSTPVLFGLKGQEVQKVEKSITHAIH